MAEFLASDLVGKITGVAVDVTCGITEGLNYRVGVGINKYFHPFTVEVKVIAVTSMLQNVFYSGALPTLRIPVIAAKNDAP